MEDVFDVLVEDHEEIRQALAELEKGPTAATGATEDQLMLRKIMTEELIIEEAKHEEIELTCVWPAVRGHVRDGDQLADRAVCAELEQLLGAFTQAARKLFDFEERQVWPRLRSALTDKAADELGLKVLAARQAVPVPPFPRASASSS